MNFLDILDKQIAAIHEQIDNEKDQRTKSILRHRLVGVFDAVLLYKDHFDDWVSTKQYLPSENMTVLVVYEDHSVRNKLSHKMTVCKFNREHKSFYTDNGGNCTHLVTHWRELPSFPDDLKGE